MNFIDYLYKNYKFFFIGATCCLFTIFFSTIITKCSGSGVATANTIDRTQVSGKIENVILHNWIDVEFVGPKEPEVENNKKPINPKIVVWSWKGGSTIKKEQLERTILAVLLKLPQTTADWSAVQLLMETAAVESHRGTHVTQLRSGPARGIYQMEVATIKDTLKWLKKNKVEQYKAVQFYYNKKESEEWNYKHNVPWQTAMAISYYWRMSYGNDAIKDALTVEDRANLYKKIWNTSKGATSIAVYYEKVKLYA